ncbi:MAG TPA: hypothetical protein VMR33_17555 [Candidatus Baltobacteraceae bacterium]|jgi:hypothetical protein|nr:hypothetical protein [Candidatus Baltobacteraceae bacterium]
MNLRPCKKQSREKGWALIAVMTLAATALLMLAGVMSWANENATVVARNNEYFATTYAAEAATEKALGAMVRDDQDYGEGIVFTQTAYYSGLYPTAADNPYWTNYQFSGGTVDNTVIVSQVNASTTNILGPPYSGLTCVGATYDIIANARNVNSMYGITSTVGQKITFGQIPIFQFAVFYQDVMEIDPGATMNITGPVHGNNNIYLAPNGVTLTFYGPTSSALNIYTTENPQDPTGQSAGSNNFNGNSHVSNVSPLNLPVGTNVSGSETNVAQNVLSILQVPPASELPTSPVGTNRLYNQTDMIITITNGNNINVTSGVNLDGQAITVSNSEWGKFISTNGTFYDGREGINVDPVNINVSNLVQWTESPTNALRSTLLSARSASFEYVSSVYVVDERSFSNAVIITNISYTTNTATRTTASYPTAGTFEPPVATNTMATASATYPGAGTYYPPVTTNTSVVTVGSGNYPEAGTFVPPVTTNTTRTTGPSYPGAGTYVGSVTHIGSTYTYNLITGYTYNEISGYIYTGITGYTYAGITGVTTNDNYLTNYVQFAIPGVVLTNGAVLPPNGLSIATPDPAYIVGNWNVASNFSSPNTEGTSNTFNTLPSAVFADAVTILSPAWNPANSALGIAARDASEDTVNAALLTGNVPSNGTYYSGGVENFVRFLESWTGVDFFYNGSMVEMFPSQIANARWPGTGSVYNPPVRNWTFDQNFTNPLELPPLTPRVIDIIRDQWSSLPAGTTAANF